MVISEIYFTYQSGCPSFSFYFFDLEELSEASIQQKH